MVAGGAVGISTPPGNPGICPPQPEPEPGLPPEFILMEPPERVTPLGSILTKLPPTLSVSSDPASITIFMPALWCTSLPASTSRD